MPALRPSSRPAAAPARVLVLDSDIALTRALTQLLGSVGHDVHPCNRLDDASDAFLRWHAQVLVAEVLWSGKGPGELVRDFRRQLPGVTVVALTGCSAVETIVEVVRGGAFDCLLKPAEPERVVEAVDRAFRHHALLAPPPVEIVKAKSLLALPIGECSAALPPPLALDIALQGPERQIIADALARNRFHRGATAAELQIDRTTLYKKMRKYGLDVGEPNVIEEGPAAS